MGIRSFLSKPLAAIVANQQRDWSLKPGETQPKVFRSIIGKAAYTVFGIDHGFNEIRSHADYVERVPIRDYEALSPYVKMILEGRKIYYGLESLCILLKLQELPLVRNIFRLQGTPSLIILIVPEMPY